MSFSKEDMILMNVTDEYVPDVLLNKAWYQSEASRMRKDCALAKQVITRNEVLPGVEYTVEIRLMDQRVIKYVEHYTYELNYFLDGTLKATVISTYLEEVPYAIPHYG